MKQKFPMDEFRNIIEQPIINLGYELVDVKIEKEEAYVGQEVVVIYINKPDGITIDDCVRVNKMINPLLDEVDIIDDSYIVSVSSLGVKE